jgi:hypothetical protein
MKHTVARSCRTDRQSLDAACEPARVVGLDQQVHVITLDGELQDTEHRVRGVRDRRANGNEETVGAKRRQTHARPQRHVHRTAPIVHRAALVRHATATRCRLPARTLARPTPAGGLAKIERQLPPAATHLIWQ